MSVRVNSQEMNKIDLVEYQIPCASHLQANASILLRKRAPPKDKEDLVLINENDNTDRKDDRSYFNFLTERNNIRNDAKMPLSNLK